MKSLIIFSYIREETISDIATVKNGEGVFTHTSPRSSAPVNDRGIPTAIVSVGPAVTELRTGSRALARPMAGHLKGTYRYVPVPSRAILPT